MVRVVGFQLLVFLLPFLVYAFYLYFAGTDPMNRESWSRNAVYWLAVTGLVLTVAGLLLIAATVRVSALPLLALVQVRFGFGEPGLLG